MTIKTPKGMKECPKCDPSNPELDEAGRPYTCYLCGDSGWVLEGYIDEPDPMDVERERRDFASERDHEDDWWLRDRWAF